MSGRQFAWKDALKEPNAIGWISLIIVVVAIGFGAVYFGNDSPPTAGRQTMGQAAH